MEMARGGEMVIWPLASVTIASGRNTLVVHVASDYVAIGTLADHVYVPLQPETAQAVADTWGMLLPTCALVKAIHEQASVKVSPLRSGDLAPPQPNKGADLTQIMTHSRAVSAQLRGLGFPPGLTSGPKKDVVIGNLWKPGKVLIYGWMKGAIPPGPDPSPMTGDPARDKPPWRIQMYSNVHGSFYYDYSHGVRLVSPKCQLNGQDTELTKVLQDATLSSLVSWEGPLRSVRYPTPGKPLPSPSTYVPTTPGLAYEGLQIVTQSALL